MGMALTPSPPLFFSSTTASLSMRVFSWNVSVSAVSMVPTMAIARAIAIVGTIETADTETFQEKTRMLREAVVLLKNNGGDGVKAIPIGEKGRAGRVPYV